MADTNSRFTQDALNVLRRMDVLEKEGGQGAFGSQHMLVAILQETECVGNKILRSLEVDPNQVEALAKLMWDTKESDNDEQELTSHVKRILERAVDEARRRRKEYIDTHDLLLGMVRYGKGAGYKILEKVGISPQILRERTRQLLPEIEGEENYLRPTLMNRIQKLLPCGMILGIMIFAINIAFVIR